MQSAGVVFSTRTDLSRTMKNEKELVIKSGVSGNWHAVKKKNMGSTKKDIEDFSYCWGWARGLCDSRQLLTVTLVHLIFWLFVCRLRFELRHTLRGRSRSRGTSSWYLENVLRINRASLTYLFARWRSSCCTAGSSFSTFFAWPVVLVRSILIWRQLVFQNIVLVLFFYLSLPSWTFLWNRRLTRVIRITFCKTRLSVLSVLVAVYQW